MRAGVAGVLGARGALAMLLALAFCRNAASLQVRIAPLALVDAAAEDRSGFRRPERDLARMLDAAPLDGSVEFPLVEGCVEAPLSFLEAARLCERGGYPYILYGFLQRRGSVYSSELKLLSRDGKRIEASFFATDDEAHYGRLISDLSSKVADYFLEDLGVVPSGRRPEPARNVFEMPLSAGYWTPVGAWSETLMGLFRADFGLRFFPRKPMAGLKSHPLYVGIGLDAEYALGRSQPGLEPALLHRIQARLPVELLFGFAGGSFGLALGGLVEFDILRQERRYADFYEETSSAGGFLASLVYRRALTDRVSLGIELEFDAIYYSVPLYSVSPRLCVGCALARKAGAAAEQR
jgi:hypothetical protein